MKYVATLTTMGQKYTTEGESAADAIMKLNPKNVKAKGILMVEHNGAKREKILMPHVASRLFNSVGLNREVAMKNITTLFIGI